MDIIKNNFGYVIVDFGDLVIEEQLKAIKLFIKEEDKMLFQTFEADINSINEVKKEELKEDFFEQFYFDTTYFYDGCKKEEMEEKVKELLILEYYKNNKQIDSNTKEDIKGKLLNDFRKGSYEVKSDIKDEIKELIFKYYFYNEDKEAKEFIDQRTIFINNVSFWGYSGIVGDISNVIWYEPKGDEEILYAMKYMYFYTCVIINKDSEFNEFSYGLIYYETASGYDLAILERETGSFMKDVYPKINDLINN